ncbi:MAG: hypothetical protein JOZ46_05590, partial [Candidatus Dormibacteraeota bacterium]|nr:hypothetical protein [Candidatus Dormibacteraeota bacterium]
MSTDTEAAELEATLRALYESVTPPAARPHAAVPSATAFRNLGDPITAIRRRRLARRLLAAAVAVMVAVSAVLLVRTRVGTHASPAASASLSVYVLPAGEQLNCTIALSALSDPSATGFVSFDAGHVAFHPVTTTGNTYVPGLHRWVDTTPQMVSPDGNSYVTGGLDPSQPGIAVVDAGGTHAILKQANGYLSPLGFSPEGIVLLDTTPAASGPRETMPISLL